MSDNDTTAPDAPTAWVIPSGRMDHVRSKLAAIKGRCTRKGLTPLDVTVHDAPTHAWDWDAMAWTSDAATAVRSLDRVNARRAAARSPQAPRPWVEGYEVTLGGDAPSLGGWSIAASVQHLKNAETGDWANLISGTPGFEAPVEFRDAPPDCQHCGTKRWRKGSFLVVHEDGTVRQVGSSCIRDFLGHDCDRMLLWASFCSFAHDASDCSFGDWDEEDLGERVGRTTHVPLWPFVEDAALMIAAHGWRSRKQEFEGSPSTLSRVWSWRSPPATGSFAAADRAERQRIRETFKAEAERLVANVRTMAGDLAQVEKPDDFQRNILALTGSGLVPLKGAGPGIAACLPHVALMHVEKRERRKTWDDENAKRRAAAPDWTPGRLVIEGVVTSAKWRDTDFGSSLKLVVELDDGRRCWGTCPATLAEAEGDEGGSGIRGCRVRLTATVAPSDDDATFAFYKRPAKAAILERPEENGAAA